MATLVSPGVSISVTDESQYVPSTVGTIPFILFASGQNKLLNNAVTPGSTKANAGKVFGVNSQRELVATFGAPVFRVDATNTPVHGDELNEYGLLAAYSALGLGNRIWAMRADIDLDQLVGTTVRPTGEVPNNTNWLDISETQWGIFEYDQVNDKFSAQTPLIITDLADTTSVGGVAYPNQSIGALGSYAVVVKDTTNYHFYKNYLNVWTIVGSDEWQYSHPTVKGTDDTISFNDPADFTINNTTVNIPDGTDDVADIANIINGLNILGVKADVVDGQLAIFASELSRSDGVVADGAIDLVDGDGTPLAALGIDEGKYYSPRVSHAGFNAVPAWSTFDAVPRPSGSIWIKTTAVGGGVNVSLKKWNTNTKNWVQLAVPVFGNGYEAVYGLDAVGGGVNIAAGAVFAKHTPINNGNHGLRFYTLARTGQVKVTGSPAGTFTAGDTFSIIVSQPGTDVPTTYNIVLSGINGAAFVNAILATNIPNIGAKLETSGAITLTHRAGGLITLINTTIGRNPVTTAGFNSNTEGVLPFIVPGAITLTNWEAVTYTFSDETPYTAPESGTLWYYNDPAEVDIMICDIDGWKGYKNVSRDSRGYDLSDTDPLGVIVSASEPETQTDSSSLVAGDLWLDTSDLENYPRLRRYTDGGVWSLIDNTDSVSQNGIVFADARWDMDGTTDPISGVYPSVADMQNSDYLDLDAPDYRLYPRGTLLFNTRRSGYNVKKFVRNYFNALSFPNAVLPEETSCWINESGLKNDNSPYAGHHAQRSIVVQAMKAAIDGNDTLREEAVNFTLLACPGYPELIPNMVALNNDRANTGFIIGDTPMTLANNANDITAYNNSEAVTRDPYLAIYYPAGLSNDLAGNEVVVPASHIALRTFIRSDNVSFQWFAPAGTRRGLVDNAAAIGYIDAASGNFVRVGINQQMRDTLYLLNINPITLLEGSGLVVYGQKTRSAYSSALDRVNVARLVNYIRSTLQKVANGFLFEPNDKIIRDQARNAVSGILNNLVANRGIYDYLVVCDDSNNTPERIARNELYIDVAIEPTKSVEFIYIPIRLKNPGTIGGQG